uniref:hypothetical protein n=1 Tax=Staphylococcus capitis TaxID=29388 RepID=UPI003709833E
MDVFSEKLRKLVLEGGMKGKEIVGVDGGFRRGCKLGVINAFGRFIGKRVIYPHPGKSKIEDSEKEVLNTI